MGDLWRGRRGIERRERLTYSVECWWNADEKMGSGGITRAYGKTLEGTTYETKRKKKAMKANAYDT